MYDPGWIQHFPKGNTALLDEPFLFCDEFIIGEDLAYFSEFGSPENGFNSSGRW
jgi:hypothetical protein